MIQRFLAIISGLMVLAQVAQAQEGYLQRNSFRMAEGEAPTTIFLTFDDGPTPQVTLAVAEVLRDYKIRATFFAIGQKSVSTNARYILSRLVDDGHLIANHTWEHRFSYSNEAAFELSLNRTTDALQDFLPDSGLILFRSPGGVWNGSRTRWTNRTRDGGKDTDYQTFVGPFGWNAGGVNKIENGKRVNAADWACWSKGISMGRCATGYLAKIRANHAAGEASIVLMHDLRIQTATLLRLVLEGLEEDGIKWQFKRLDEVPWPYAHVP